MVLLDVLDESWVIKLCRVIAVGRQIAVRPEKVFGIQIALQAKIFCQLFRFYSGHSIHSTFKTQSMQSLK